MKKSKPEQPIADLLRSEGFKVTPARLVLLEILMTKCAPLTVEDIAAQMPTGINATTIYRALDQFAQTGLVHQTHFRDGKTYYEYQAHHHHHIVCTTCGVKEEISLCVESSLARVIKESKKFNQVQDHILEFFGVCQDCTTV